MAVRAITFDFWRTLFRDQFYAERQRLRIDAMAQATGRDDENINAALIAVWVEFERVHREEQRTLSPIDAVTMTAERLEVDLAPSVVARLAETFSTAILRYSPAPIDGALEAVRAAAARGPVGIISDTGVSPGSSLRVLLERHGFGDYITAYAFSDEVGVSKPQAPMFEKVATELGVGVNELFHIGDLEFTDVHGAQALGSMAGLFTGQNNRYREETKADYVFDTWHAFIRKLPALAGDADVHGWPSR